MIGLPDLSNAIGPWSFATGAAKEVAGCATLPYARN